MTRKLLGTNKLQITLSLYHLMRNIDFRATDKA